MNQDWSEYQKTLVEYCKFADICQHVYLKDKNRVRDIIANCIKTDIKKDTDRQMASAFYNLQYSMRDIFEDHDKEDEKLYETELLCESIIESLAME